jgi:hypothetical protein
VSDGETTWWLGIYGDAVRDFGADRTRLSVGPEIGAYVVGIDGGFLVELADDEPTRTGLSARVVLTVAFAGVYARGGHFVDGAPGSDFAEFGVLLKIPVQVNRREE